MKNEGYKVEIIRTINSKFIKDWNDLWQRAENANIFNSYQWFRTCQETEVTDEFEIHACYQDGKLIAVLPLQLYKQFGIKVFGSLHTRFLVDTPFLLEKNDKESIQHFFTHLLVKRSLYIQKIDNETVKMLHKLFPKLFFTLLSVNPSVNFNEDSFASVSPSTISQIKKIIRKNPNQFRFELYTGKKNLEEHLNTMFRLEQHSSKKLRSMDIFSQPQIKIFFTTLSKNAPEMVRIGFLYYDNKPISYQFGFVYRDIFSAFQTAYLSEYAKLRPGKTMLFHLLTELHKQQIKVLDLGGGISSYKREFTPDYRLLYDLYYSSNPLILFWWKSINTARRIKQRLFPKKNTRDHEFLFKTLA